MHHWRVICALLALVALAGCGYGETGDEGSRSTLNWYAYKEPGGSFEEIAKECTKKSGGKYKIKLVDLPTNADQQRELLVRRLAAEDSDIDLMTMDVIWTGEFAEAGWVLEWKGADAEAARKGRIPSLVKTAEYEDKLWAAPVHHQHPAPVVQQGPGQGQAAGDLGRAVRPVEEARRQGQDRGPGGALRGPHRLVQHARRLAGRPDRRRERRCQGRRHRRAERPRS